VIGVLTEGGRVTGVKTSQGPFAAPVVLIAANAWSRPLLQSVGQDLPLYVERHEVVVAERPPAAAADHATILDGPLDLYFRIEGPHLTLIGTGTGEPADPDTYSEATSAAHVERVGERLAKRFPVMHDAGVRRSLVGIYDMTPDDLPVLDRVPGIEGLFCAVGFCGHGFKIAPAVGAVMAELITTGGTLALDLGLVRFTRFADGQFSISPTDYLDQMTPQARQN
jgi:sarcosine oxidase subunit beta